MDIVQVRRGRTWRKRRAIKSCQYRPRILLDPDYIDLLKWAKQNGTVFDDIRPAAFHDTGRGMIATRKIRSNHEIISVPEKLLITSQTALNSVIGTIYHKVTSQRNVKISEKCLVCLYLIYLKFLGKDSFWFVYIKTLPTTFNTPSYFDEQELSLLPSSCYKKSINQIDELKHSFEKVKGVFGRALREFNVDFSQELTYENFRWAWFVINTRSVYLKNNKEQHTGYHDDGCHDNNYALAPVLDLLNHSDVVEIDAGRNTITRSYTITSVTEYSKGQQVYINYGPHDNSTLLIEYGFILPKNIHSSYKFDPQQIYTLCNQPRTRAFMKKVDIIKTNNFDKDFSCSLEHGLSWNLLTSIRILALQDGDLDQWTQHVFHSDLSSAKNEIVVQQWVLLIVSSLLETSAREDYCCLGKDGIKSSNMRLALELRKQETQILENVLCQFKTT